MMLRRLAAGLAVAAALAACSPADAVDTALVLFDLRAGEGPSRLKAATPTPERRAVAWRHDGAPAEGDLYLLSDHAPRAALVLVPGLAPEGRNDRRTVAFARTLARVGFAVLVPDLPGARAQRASAADGVAIAAAARYLLARPEGQGPVGVAAISYAVGPAILAAGEADLAARLDFMVAIGGYYDATAVVTFFTTGYFRGLPGAPWRYMEPNAYGKWVFVLANAAKLESDADRTTLIAMARRKLADLDADIGDLARSLGPEGAMVAALLANNDPARVPALVAALPAAVRADLSALDLSARNLGALRARFIVVHGRDDAIIPYTESQALARALPAGRTRLTLLDSLAHADLSPAGVMDGWRLARAVYALLGERRPD
ncbi:MAG: alpha/beta hydrolase [Rhodospirillales bacterium]|nr:alpha/beta hydrolase [Rhodospirillales bacterium]